MAILMQSEYEDLKYRMNTAQSRNEYEYYREKLRDLEQYHAQRELIRYNPVITGTADMARNPAPIPMQETITPLSFLKNADKKLLLTGEMA